MAEHQRDDRHQSNKDQSRVRWFQHLLHPFFNRDRAARTEDVNGVDSSMHPFFLLVQRRVRAHVQDTSGPTGIRLYLSPVGVRTSSAMGATMALDVASSQGTPIRILS